MELQITEIRCAIQIALLGEIRPSVRAVVFKYDSSKKYFMLRYYLDTEPQYDDYYSAECAVVEFSALFSWEMFDVLDSECIYSELPLPQLDPLDGFVFARSPDYNL